MARGLRSFDAYSKTSDDYKVRTTSGAIATLIVSSIIIILVLSETSRFLSIKTKSELRVDPAINTKLNISFDVVFPKIACSYITLDAMDVSGNHQIDLDHSIYKIRLSSDGKPLGTKVETPINGDTKGSCGDCYGAADESKKCCNTCEEVQEQYRKKGWAFRPKEVRQCVEEGYIENLKSQSSEGCHFQGYILVNKVKGNFHFAPGKASSVQHSHVHDFEMLKDISDFNLTHTINHISFGKQFPGQLSPLDSTDKVWKEKDSAIFQYYLKIVPTSYESINGNVIYSNQYSVTENQRSISGNSHRGGLPGIFFMYDFSPLMVSFKESRSPFGHYITTICVIIGGLYAFAGLVETYLYRALRNVLTNSHFQKLE